MSMRDIHNTTQSLQESLEALRYYKAIRTLPSHAAQLINELENDLETLARQVSDMSGIDFAQADKDRERVAKLTEHLKDIETEQLEHDHDKWLDWARSDSREPLC